MPKVYEPRACRRCNTRFVPEKGQQRNCPACREHIAARYAEYEALQPHRGEPEERTCVNCATPFTRLILSGTSKRYCSPLCDAASHMNRLASPRRDLLA